MLNNRKSLNANIVNENFPVTEARNIFNREYMSGLFCLNGLILIDDTKRRI